MKGLAAGAYTVKANAKGFEEYQSAQVQVAAGQLKKSISLLRSPRSRKR